jgi:hypothetical protein
MNPKMPACSHQNVTKLYLVSSSNSIHPPYSEVWMVRCNSCSMEFEEVMPDEK